MTLYSRDYTELKPAASLQVGDRLIEDKTDRMVRVTEVLTTEHGTLLVTAYTHKNRPVYRRIGGHETVRVALAQ